MQPLRKLSQAKKCRKLRPLRIYTAASRMCTSQSVCGALDCHCNLHAYDSIMMDDVRLKAMNMRDECALAAGRQRTHTRP